MSGRLTNTAKNGKASKKHDTARSQRAQRGLQSVVRREGASALPAAAAKKGAARRRAPAAAEAAPKEGWRAEAKLEQGFAPKSAGAREARAKAKKAAEPAAKKKGGGGGNPFAALTIE